MKWIQVVEGNRIWRRALLVSLEFDPVLNFDDARCPVSISLQAKKRGFKVIYDPRALVYHHPAPRAPELRRQERGFRLYCYCRDSVTLHYSEAVFPLAPSSVSRLVVFNLANETHGGWDHWRSGRPVRRMAQEPTRGASVAREDRGHPPMVPIATISGVWRGFS